MAYQKSASWDHPKWEKSSEQKEEKEREKYSANNGQLWLQRHHRWHTQAVRTNVTLNFYFINSFLLHKLLKCWINLLKWKVKNIVFHDMAFEKMFCLGAILTQALINYRILQGLHVAQAAVTERWP